MKTLAEQAAQFMKDHRNRLYSRRLRELFILHVQHVDNGDTFDRSVAQLVDEVRAECFQDVLGLLATIRDNARPPELAKSLTNQVRNILADQIADTIVLAMNTAIKGVESIRDDRPGIEADNE